MRKINIADITLSESAAGKDLTLSFKEKLEIAKHLDKMKVDVLELPQLENLKTDALLVRTIATTMQNCAVSINVGATEAGVDDAWAAVMKAERPRLHVALPVSTVQMEYMYHKKQGAMLELIDAMVKKCAALCKDVDFTAEDATRAEPDFLKKALDTAISAGATTITISDTAGIMLPEEFAQFISELRSSVPGLEKVALAVKCANELKMSAACAMTAVKAGACEIKACASGDTLPTLSSLSQIFRLRGDSVGVSCNLNSMEIQRLTKQIEWITRSKKSTTTPFDTGISAGSGAEFSLNSSDSLDDVAKAVAQLGYDLAEDDIAKVYESFSHIASKKAVSSKELEAIVASVALQVPPTYRLKSFVINSGNLISATANISLDKGDRMMQGVSVGDGPIDAAFLAIEKIIGTHYDLDDFQIQAVTEGREAVGSAVVKLRSANGKLYSGRGISTDIIGASIRAYINALNKIVYEEN
jgi:2-isopropylmalate synthase